MGMRDLLPWRARRLAGEPDEAPFARLGARLMNQQCWCWGRDISRPAGNLLLCFGFERVRPPAGVSGSSRYRIAPRPGCEISLWGFGALIADGAGAIYLNRFEFLPRLCAPPSGTRNCWRPADLASVRQPECAREWQRTGTLCAELLRFIGAYESWVAEAAGLRYRQQTVDAFRDATLSAMEAKQLWPRLAKQVARHYGRRAVTGW